MAGGQFVRTSLLLSMLVTVLVSATYSDGRPSTAIRVMNVHDQAMVLRHGNCRSGCDDLGSRDVWVYQTSPTKYFMNYDGAGKLGWFASLATSRDGRIWIKKGAVLAAGSGCSVDSRSASYGTTYYASDKYTNKWVMYYLGTPNVSDPINKIPSFPYLTLEAESNSPTGPWLKNYDKSPFSVVPNTYYSVTASPGMIIKQNGEHFMFFSSATIINGKIKRTIGLARSIDLISWQLDNSPILPIEEQVENTSLYYQRSNNTWYLFTNHVGIDEHGVEYTDSVWVYWSTDLLFWNPIHKAVVIDASNTTGHYKCIGLPSVITRGNELFVYYDTPGGDSMSHLGRDIGLAIVDLPITFRDPTTPSFAENERYVDANQNRHPSTRHM